MVKSFDLLVINHYADPVLFVELGNASTTIKLLSSRSKTMGDQIQNRIVISHAEVQSLIEALSSQLSNGALLMTILRILARVFGVNLFLCSPPRSVEVGRG